MGIVRIIALGAVCALASTALAAEPLKPTGNWVVDYAEAQCVATRAFGSKEKPLHLLIKPSPTSDVVQIALVRDGSKKAGTQEDATLKFSDGSSAKVKLLDYGVEKRNIRSINLSSEFVPQMARSTSIEWHDGLSRKILDTGALGDVMKVLGNCRDDLRAYWNIDEARQAALKSRVKSNSLASYFSSDDYPAQAMHDDESGMASVVLLINEKGEVKECMVDGTSGVATLDAMACIVLRHRAKFEPAIGADGKPTRDSVNSRIRWELP